MSFHASRRLSPMAKREAQGPLFQPLKKTDASSVYRIMAAFLYPIEQSARRTCHKAARSSGAFKVKSRAVEWPAGSNGAMGHKTFGFSMYDVLVRILRFSDLHPVCNPQIKCHSPHIWAVSCGRHVWQGYSGARVRVIFVVFSAELERRLH